MCEKSTPLTTVIVFLNDVVAGQRRDIILKSYYFSKQPSKVFVQWCRHLNAGLPIAAGPAHVMYGLELTHNNVVTKGQHEYGLTSDSNGFAVQTATGIGVEFSGDWFDLSASDPQLPLNFSLWVAAIVPGDPILGSAAYPALLRLVFY